MKYESVAQSHCCDSSVVLLSNGKDAPIRLSVHNGAIKCIIITQVYAVTNYEILVLFYEFRNPSNLACANHYCQGDGGYANCCDDLSTRMNCQNQCNTQFRLSLKEFGTTVNHRSRHGPDVFYTGHFNTSSIVFTRGATSLINVSNPFPINSTAEWTVSYSYGYLEFITSTGNVVSGSYWMDLNNYLL